MLIGFILLADLAHFIMFAKQKLKPAVFLIVNILQAGAWAGVVVLDLVVIAKGKGVQNFYWPIIVW